MKTLLPTRRVYEENGFTLVEMMVTILIMTMVMFALYSIFDMSIRVFSFGNDKVEAAENARLGLEKMDREIRAAYPVDRMGGKQHVFFTAGLSGTPVRPEERSITFGNDLPAGATPSNRKIDLDEEITYELRSRNDINVACPSTGAGGVCVLARRKGAGGTFEPVVEYIVPNGLTFTYLKSNLTATDSSGNGTDIGVVRIRLTVNVDSRMQTLTTDVDLRNRG